MGSGQPILVKAPSLSLKSGILNGGAQSVDPGMATDIVVIKEGEANILVNGIAYSVTAGQLLIVPGLPYSITESGPDAGISLLRLAGVRYGGFEEGVWPFLSVETVFESGPATQNMFNVCMQLESELSGKMYGYEQSAGKLTEYLLILLERNLPGAASGSKDLVENIRDYMDKNYEKNITLSSLADMFYVSSFHISHVFKEKFGISPIQYLINIRINTARELLAKTQHTIFEVSNMVGYPNVNYFHILFKRFTGLSPGGYRKAHAR